MEKLPVWGDVIPGNTDRPKTEVMTLKPAFLANRLLDTVRWILTVKAGSLKNGKRVIDSYTHYCVRKEDPDYHDTFSDVPYLIPYIAEGSRQAVIVVPGGGYCVKSMEGEGTQIGEALQKAGITAFVLWYRTNPYYQPYPLMDLQRAIRYVRYHSREYGIDPAQIGAVGFSAGGAQVSLFQNVLQPGVVRIPDYGKDAVDAVDDALNFMGLVYPALSYKYNQTMMYASFPEAQVRDPAVRASLQASYDAVGQFHATGIPHFLCWGTKDTMVSIDGIQEYSRLLEKTGTPCRGMIVDGASHGYGAAIGTEYAFWLEEFIQWLKDNERRGNLS